MSVMVGEIRMVFIKSKISFSFYKKINNPFQAKVSLYFYAFICQFLCSKCGRKLEDKGEPSLELTSVLFECRSFKRHLPVQSQQQRHQKKGRIMFNSIVNFEYISHFFRVFLLKRLYLLGNKRSHCLLLTDSRRCFIQLPPEYI